MIDKKWGFMRISMLSSWPIEGTGGFARGCAHPGSEFQVRLRDRGAPDIVDRQIDAFEFVLRMHHGLIGQVRITLSAWVYEQVLPAGFNDGI
jgi:hypothetical protein